MNELEEFKKVLDSDENIVYSYKPNKTRFVWLNILGSFLFTLIIVAFFVVFGVVWLINSDKVELPAIILFSAGGLIFVLFNLVTIIFSFVRYNKTYYVVTNKRLVIKTGVIGVDFRTLDLHMIQSVDVKVGLLDKFINPNTGSIIVGSSSTPIGGAMNQRSVGNPLASGFFSFADIDNPYDVAKQIKSHVDLVKK